MATQADVDAVDDAIVANAQQPARVKFGNREVEQHSIDDQIKAAQYAAAQEVAAAGPPGHFGLRFSQLVPPGCG